jgi:isoaspartyl peptidase/L-asparaginase-like protein (Ntn-hydrolase superfamily)
MRELTENARDRLASGARALDVVEYAVVQMESSGLYVAGRGSAPNSAGYVELDASIMDGPVSAAGAVSCLRDVVNPVSVARRVMEATPHVMLSGAGALAFARTQGFEEVGEPRKYYSRTRPTARSARSRSTRTANWRPRPRRAAPSASWKAASAIRQSSAPAPGPTARSQSPAPEPASTSFVLVRHFPWRAGSEPGHR